MKLTDAEWSVLEVLWSGDQFALGEITAALQKWNKNTVYTYLTRMNTKGLVSIDHRLAKPYAAAVTREDCAQTERNELLNKVYGGSASELIAAFLKDTSISTQEVERLKKLLEEMET